MSTVDNKTDELTPYLIAAGVCSTLALGAFIVSRTARVETSDELANRLVRETIERDARWRVARQR